MRFRSQGTSIWFRSMVAILTAAESSCKRGQPFLIGSLATRLQGFGYFSERQGNAVQSFGLDSYKVGNGPSYPSWLLYRQKREKAERKAGLFEGFAHQKAVDGAESMSLRLVLHAFGKKSLDRITHQRGSGTYEALCRSGLTPLTKILQTSTPTAGAVKQVAQLRTPHQRSVSQLIPAIQKSWILTKSRLEHCRHSPWDQSSAKEQKQNTCRKTTSLLVRPPHALPPANFRPAKVLYCKRCEIGGMGTRPQQSKGGTRNGGRAENRTRKHSFTSLHF
jgi:hypothetical protein